MKHDMETEPHSTHFVCVCVFVEKRNTCFISNSCILNCHSFACHSTQQHYSFIFMFIFFISIFIFVVLRHCFIADVDFFFHLCFNLYLSCLTTIALNTKLFFLFLFCSIALLNDLFFIFFIFLFCFALLCFALLKGSKCISNFFPFSLAYRSCASYTYDIARVPNILHFCVLLDAN